MRSCVPVIAFIAIRTVLSPYLWAYFFLSIVVRMRSFITRPRKWRIQWKHIFLMLICSVCPVCSVGGGDGRYAHPIGVRADGFLFSISNESISFILRTIRMESG